MHVAQQFCRARCGAAASGGRAALAAKLREFEPSGSGQGRGPSDQSPIIGSVTEQLYDEGGGDPLLKKIAEEENERPGDTDIPFDAQRFGLPSPSVLLPLLE